MSTQLILIADERGFTVQHSTTHQTQAGALAHFTEMLAQLHHQHATKEAAGAAILAGTAFIEPTGTTSGQPVSVRSRITSRNSNDG